jgi:metal-responsive CopG/Arc/MetJ family transcriptional regulator
MGRTAVTVGFSMSPALAESVELLAREEGRSKSALFRDMVRTYQEQRELVALEEVSQYGAAVDDGAPVIGPTGRASSRPAARMERVAVTLPDDLVGEIDRIAERSGLSRSGVIREASAGYVAEKLTAERDHARRAAVEDTLAFFEEMKRMPVLDDTPVLEMLREMRGPLDRDIESKG